jgi:hypothetical protein
MSRDEIALDFLTAEFIKSQAELRETLAAINENLKRLADQRDGQRAPETILVRDVAKMFHVEEGTVYNWVSTGKIPFRKANGATFFLLDELLAWTKPVAKNSIEPPTRRGGSARGKEHRNGC